MPSVKIEVAALDRIDPRDLMGDSWDEWYSLTPAERWAATDQLWDMYLALGGSLDPEPDPQSPFFDADEWRALSGKCESERPRSSFRS